MNRAIAGRPQALIALGSPVMSPSRKQVAETALKHRLPTISMYTNAPEVGGA